MKTYFVDNSRRKYQKQPSGKRKAVRAIAVVEKRVQNKPSNAYRIEGSLAIICSNTRYVRMAG